MNMIGYSASSTVTSITHYLVLSEIQLDLKFTLQFKFDLILNGVGVCTVEVITYNIVTVIKHL